MSSNPASVETEEDRLMRHIEKKGRAGSFQNSKKSVISAPASEPVSKPAATGNQPVRKWQQKTEVVDQEALRRAQEMERQREEEGRKQREMEARMLETSGRKGGGVNDFSIDRFLIKTEGSGSNLQSSPATSQPLSSPSNMVGEDTETDTKKEEQRLLKKVNLDKRGGYSPADIEEHRKKLEGKVSSKSFNEDMNNFNIPIITPVSGNSASLSVAPPVPEQSAVPIHTSLTMPPSTHSTSPRKSVPLSPKINSTASSLSQKLVALKGLQVSSFSSVGIDTFVMRVSDYATKLREVIVMESNASLDSFNYRRFEELLISFANFLLDNLSVLGNRSSPTVELINHLLQSGADFIDSLGRSSQAEYVNTAVLNQALYSVTQSVTEQAKKRKEEKKRQQQPVVVKTIARIVEQSQILASQMVDYDANKFDNSLQAIVSLVQGVNQHFEDTQAIANRTNSIHEAAKQVTANQGEDPRDRTKMDQKLVRLISDLQTHRSH